MSANPSAHLRAVTTPRTSWAKLIKLFAVRGIRRAVRVVRNATLSHHYQAVQHMEVEVQHRTMGGRVGDNHNLDRIDIQFAICNCFLWRIATEIAKSITSARRQPKKVNNPSYLYYQALCPSRQVQRASHTWCCLKPSLPQSRQYRWSRRIQLNPQYDHVSPVDQMHPGLTVF